MLLAPFAQIGGADVPTESMKLAIKDAANVYSVPYPLLLAIAKAESSFDPFAVGDNGESYGLFQINKYWLDRFNIPYRDIFDIKTNARWGAFVLSDCMSRYPVISDAVGCYAGTSKSGPTVRNKYAAHVLRSLKKISVE